MAGPMVIVEHANVDGSDMTRAQWWGEKEPHLSVFAVVRGIDMRQAYRRASYLRHARLYSNVEVTNLSATGYARPLGNSKARVSLNVVRSCIDTGASKVSKNKPRVLMLTSGGEYSVQKRGKMATKYLDGWFESSNAYRLGRSAFRDAEIYGDGFVKLSKGDDEVEIEKIAADSVFVDDAEAVNGTPRQMHYVVHVSKQQLAALYPSKKTMIGAATSGRLSASGNADGSSPDSIEVVESWHLPSKRGAKDGAHSITIENATLLSEPWAHDFFPIVQMQWAEPVKGYYGSGIAEELTGIQLELNKLLRTIARAQEMFAIPRIFLESGSKINPGVLTTDTASIVMYTGSPPIMSVPQAIAPEMYQAVESWVRRAYEITGVSQAQATGVKPAGLDSGVAQREYADQVSERFVLVGQRYEEFFVDIAKIVLVFARELYREGNLPVRVKGRKFLEEVPWNDIDLEDDQFIMRPFPVSFLPTTPAGRLQSIQELVQAGFIPQEYALDLLDFPDLEAFTSLQTSSLEDIEASIEDLLETGYTEPLPDAANLQLAQQLGQQAYLRARRMTDVSAANLNALDAWVRSIAERVQAMKPPPPPQTMAQPTGVPLPPPGAELLPTGVAA